MRAIEGVWLIVCEFFDGEVMLYSISFVMRFH